MKNTAVKTREKYERKLAKAITKNGGINLIAYDQEITAVIIAEPKGFYAVDSDDLSIIRVDGIFQEVATGKIMLFNEEYANLFNFDFAFTGSKEECYKFILDKKESEALEVATLHLSISSTKS
ncbi:MAG: hypothetical protein COB17_02400 [Sulfurimonas sp.]|nr:MAG: hypothetical protein COB17_02400 [Sulfurimonas sp.]